MIERSVFYDDLLALSEQVEIALSSLLKGASQPQRQDLAALANLLRSILEVGSPANDQVVIGFIGLRLLTIMSGREARSLSDGQDDLPV